MAPPQRWRFKEAAEFIGITESHLRLKVHKREVPHIRLGERTVFFDPEALRVWIDSHRVEVKPPKPPKKKASTATQDGRSDG
jgi:excisionase family DNA binding protein